MKIVLENPPEDDEGWMTWNGGPCPVPEWCEVDAYYGQDLSNINSAYKQSWKAIVRFRLAKRGEGR